MSNYFLFFIISASSYFAVGGTSPTSTLQLHIVNHPLYGGISNNNSESFESAISISPVATNHSFFTKANGGNNHNIFAGIVMPKGHYEVKLRYKKEMIRLATNEDGEFETSVAESELADELVVEIQPYITGTKLPKVHVWTLAKVSTRLVYRFQYGVYEGEAVLKWAFTNVQGVLSPGKWYKWRVIDVKTGNLIDSDKVEIGKRVPERVECEAKGKKRVEEVLISITENGKDDGDYEYFLKNPELECAICHDEFKSVDEAWKPKGCKNHLMHKNDMEIWFKDHDICPFCREKRPTKELVPANHEEDTELIGRRDKPVVDPIGQFTILYPVLSPAHGYSWSDYEFVYELDCSEGARDRSNDEGVKDQNDGDEGTKDQKNELLASTPELNKSASHRTFSLSRFVTGKWPNSKALPSSLGCKSLASCEAFEPTKPGKQIIAVERKPQRKRVGPETATSESHVESWIRSPKSERILTDLIDSYAIWDQHSTSEKGQVHIHPYTEPFGLTRSDSLIGRASEFCSRIRHYFLPQMDSMETFNRPIEFETSSSSSEPLPRVRSRDLRATVELSSETIDELFGKLLYTALAGIVAVRDRGLLDCNCNFARLDVNALFKRGPSGDDDGAGPSEIDDGSSSALIPLPEVSEGVNRDNVINWIALKKLYGVAIRIALISGQNGQNPNNPGENRGPNHLQMFAAAYKCLDFNGQTFMNIDPRIGHYEANWMDGILEKSFVLASILPTRIGISIKWSQSFLMNKKEFEFVLENFSTELMPREALALVDQLIAKETAGDGEKTKKKNKKEKGAKTEQKTVAPISDGIVAFLENKLAELWGLGSHACPMVVFCRAMLQKVMDMPQEEARNFWEQQLYGKQKDGEKQQYGTLISEAFDRVDEMAEKKCPEMRLKSQDEEWMKTKRFVHYEEMLQIDYESKNSWRDYLTFIDQLPLPHHISSREDKKAIQMAKLEHLVERIPGQLNNDFALGPLTMYAYGHEKIQNAIKALNAEAKIYAKNIGDYLKKLVEKMRAESNTKNCQIFFSQFTKVWSKMVEIVKFMAERKEKVLENGAVKSKPK